MPRRREAMRPGATRDEGELMGRSRWREFWCDVVSEKVQIRLRRPGGFGQPQGYFVQCNQTDCQYVDENKPPCPLHIGMFSEEVRALEEARERRATEEEV
jgi:hypothetical protein